MDKIKCTTVQREAEAALKAIADKHGLKVRATGGSYASTCATLKFEFAETTTEGAVMTQAARTFQAYASMYGLSPDDLGRAFTVAGSFYKITGLNTRAPKFPITAERIDGAPFKFPAHVVKRALAA